jgi:hydroxymethylglutaryl-CoA lyase/(R)-citramalyl-CoA lyase
LKQRWISIWLASSTWPSVVNSFLIGALYLIYMSGVSICDVGPRDGLQNEAAVLEPAVRAALCDRLAGAGLKKMEAASFVNPKLVPQMAGAEDVMAALHRKPGTVYAGLVLNEKGYERALAAGVDEVHYAFAATDTFGRRNQNASTAEGLATALSLVRRARTDRMPITVTISVAFGCPFEGPVAPKHVLELVEKLMEAPADEICLADTIGVGVPRQVTELVSGSRALGATVGAHFHNTRNTGYANALAALDAGAISLDSSVGGAGGCPFAPKATGNIATEDLDYLLRGMGIETGIDLDAVIDTSRWLGERLGKELPSMVSRAGDYPQKR